MMPKAGPEAVHAEHPGARSVPPSVALPSHRDLNPAESSPVANTQAFLASIIESLDDSIIGSDLKGTILSWNKGAERLWGYTAEEALGQHITVLFPSDRRADYLRSLNTIQNHERIERFESVRVRKDGTPIDVAVILSPIFDAEGGLIGVSAIYRDIRKQKQADAELRRAKEAAEAANRAKSEFLANMSHEIRTPMNGILGMLDLALDTPLDEEQRDYLETARISAGALLVIINDILDFSKIEAGRMDLEKIPFSVPALVEETLHPFDLIARQKNLQILRLISPELPNVVLGDPTRVRQVLLNLVNNAIKFTDRGCVRVCVSPISVDTREAVIRFTVTDSGIGMSESQLKLVFDAFRQADGSTTRRYGGTGLGLSISRSLVELMNGEIGVESRPGEGSSFHFTVRLEIPAIHGTSAFAMPRLTRSAS